MRAKITDGPSRLHASRNKPTARRCSDHFRMRFHSFHTGVTLPDGKSLESQGLRISFWIHHFAPGLSLNTSYVPGDALFQKGSAPQLKELASSRVVSGPMMAPKNRLRRPNGLLWLSPRNCLAWQRKRTSNMLPTTMRVPVSRCVTHRSSVHYRTSVTGTRLIGANQDLSWKQTGTKFICFRNNRWYRDDETGKVRCVLQPWMERLRVLNTPTDPAKPSFTQAEGWKMQLRSGRRNSWALSRWQIARGLCVCRRKQTIPT